MVPETPNLLDQLLPDRHPQADFFICDVADAVLKDLMPQMEHPFYVLSKKPETTVRRYEHNGKWLEVIPSAKGQATIYDKDILIYVVSQIMHRLNRGEQVERRIQFNPRDLLIFVNRGTGGKDYEAFCEALDRLMGTVIKTNITTTLRPTMATDQTENGNDIQAAGSVAAEREGVDSVMISDSLPSLGRFAA